MKLCKSSPMFCYLDICMQRYAAYSAEYICPPVFCSRCNTTTTTTTCLIQPRQLQRPNSWHSTVNTVRSCDFRVWQCLHTQYPPYLLFQIFIRVQTVTFLCVWKFVDTVNSNRYYLWNITERNKRSEREHWTGRSFSDNFTTIVLICDSLSDPRKEREQRTFQWPIMNMDDEAMDRFEATLKNEDSVNRKIGLKRIFDIQLMEDLGLCQRWRLEVHHDGMNPRTLAQV